MMTSPAEDQSTIGSIYDAITWLGDLVAVMGKSASFAELYWDQLSYAFVPGEYLKTSKRHRNCDL